MSPKLKKPASAQADKFDFYLASVQCPEADAEFFEEVYRAHTGRELRVMREDFCGTAALCAEWVRRHEDNQAIGVDLCAETLSWGEKHILSLLGDRRQNVVIHEETVLAPLEQKSQLTSAQNFSYNIFKTPEELLVYFKAAYQNLEEDGLFVIDMMGGTDAMCEDSQDRKITGAKKPDGTALPPFTYTWEQAAYNPITGDFLCHIHFTVKRGTKIQKAFTYDWRLWTLPEVRALFLQAGFQTVEVYTEGWDEDSDDTDGLFEKREDFENEGTWIAYIVGKK